MFRLFKYLGEHKAAVVAVIVLLVIQAYCDLSLPSYTSDIVDVGIQQKGIEYAVPEVMRADTMEQIGWFLTKEETERLTASYEQGEEGIQRLAVKDEKTLKELEDLLGLPFVILLQMGESEEMTPEMLKAMIDGNMIDKEQLLRIREEASLQMADQNETMVRQMAALAVEKEYEACGVDIGKHQTSYLIRIGAKMLGLTLLMVAVAIAVGFIASRASAQIGRDLRGRVFDKVISFSNKEINEFSTASLITRSTNDIQQVQMVSVMILRMVIYAPIIGIGGIVKVARTRTGMDWIIAVAVVVIICIVALLMAAAMPKFKQMQTLVDRLNLVSREILTGIPVIRAFSREKVEEERFDRANKDLMGTQLFTNRVMTVMMPVMMLIMNGITVAIVWFGAQGIDAGNLQVGDMMAFITYTMQIVMAFLMITMISVMLPRAGVAADRIEEILNTEPVICDKEKVADGRIGQMRGVLEFKDVSFRYPGADENALEHISFKAEPGKTTAIIGSTGCGKSTLIQLIPRVYDVTEGQITVDGIDVRDLSQEKLRSCLGYVPQKGVLFSGTIESNLKYGGEEISDETMKEAARIAQAETFIEEKPEGYGSEIAQGGTNVSGGQKQRLSIARAIAKKPEIFLFDDSFSALDYKTDAALRKQLHEKLQDAAIVIVAQRISTILHADQIIVLDDGKIAGIGSHEQLLKECEAYQEIARSQLSTAELSGKGGF